MTLENLPRPPEFDDFSPMKGGCLPDVPCLETNPRSKKLRPHKLRPEHFLTANSPNSGRSSDPSYTTKFQNALLANAFEASGVAGPGLPRAGGMAPPSPLLL